MNRSKDSIAIARKIHAASRRKAGSATWSILFLLLVSMACLTQESPSASSPSPASASTQQSEGSGPALDRGTAFFTLGEHEIVVNYGRPALEGRDMLSQLEPGQVWRLGMNQASEWETSTALRFGDQSIPAGRYTIFAKYLGEQAWELLFNSKTGQWGTFEHDPSLDIAHVPLRTLQNDQEVERLTLSFESLSDTQGRFIIAWGKLKLQADFQLP